MSKPQIISQKNVFQAGLVTVKENELDFGNGLIRKHYDVYRNPAVSVYPITEDYDIYLIREYRYFFEKDIIEAVAGLIDEGEDIIAAARRELKEEAGITAKEFKIMRTMAAAGSFYRVDHSLVVAKGLTIGEATPEETEHIEVIKMSLDEAVEKVMKGEIFTSSSMVGILMLDEMRRRGEL